MSHTSQTCVYQVLVSYPSARHDGTSRQRGSSSLLPCYALSTRPHQSAVTTVACEHGRIHTYMTLALLGTRRISIPLACMYGTLRYSISLSLATAAALATVWPENRIIILLRKASIYTVDAWLATTTSLLLSTIIPSTYLGIYPFLQRLFVGLHDSRANLLQQMVNNVYRSCFIHRPHQPKVPRSQGAEKR
ncbi:hypothetical protein HDV63DRAFT_114332 [Trichoderma sp. SZMC 28014]